MAQDPAKPDDDEKTDPGLTPIEKLSPPPAPTLIAAKKSSPLRLPNLGPLEGFMKDPSITEIMVNDIRNVMIERDGQLTPSGFRFQSLNDLNRVVAEILSATGRTLSPEQPYLDTALLDGSRVNIVSPPLTLTGVCITIRKFPSQRLTIENLVERGMLSQDMSQFLGACILGKLNALICGGTGTGKTTLLNALLEFIPGDERIVAIEDTPELFISHPNSVRMQTTPSTSSSAGVSARELVANALRMRPDRIIIGECRKSEALDMLQAMNTGHDGSMTTLHANTPRDALARLETLCLMAELNLPLSAVRKQIAGAVDLIVQIKRFRDGQRRIVSICEITGMEGETITLQDIFSYNADTVQFKANGFVPTFLERLRDQGIDLANDFFS